MSARTLEEVLLPHQVLGWERGPGWLCTCGAELGDATAGSRADRLHAAHLADAVRAWLLSEERVEAASKAIALPLMKAQIPQGDGMKHYDLPTFARAALAAAVGEA